MRFFCCCFFLILLSCSKDEPNLSTVFKNEIDFIKTIGGTDNEVAKSVVSTNDGGFVVAGFIQSNDIDETNKSDTSYDYFLLKYSSNNDLMWFKTYGGSQDDRANKIIQTSDSGFAIIGYSKSNDIDVSANAGDRDFWLTKLDKNGNLQWQKSFGYSGRDIGNSLIQTSDNGFLITGELDVTSSGGQGKFSQVKKHAGGDYWAIKLNQSGDKEWSEYYGGNFTDSPKSVVQTSSGEYILVGTSDSYDVDITNNKGSYDFWVVKIAANGNLLWQKNFGGKEIDEARSIVETNSGTFMIVGDTRSSDQDVVSNNGGADIWVLNIDTDGNILWQKSIGGSSFDVARSINKTNDGGFLIAGSSRSNDNGFTNQGQNDALLVKINATGTIEWQRIIGGTEIDFFYDAIELKNNQIIAVGESTSSNFEITTNKGFSDILICKIK